MYTLYIPKDDELCPEWHIVFQILFPGNENNYFKIIIEESDIERITNAVGWFKVENHLFNKEKAEAIVFYTEFKNELGKWTHYTEDGWNAVLKHELDCELAAKHTMAHKSGDTDSIAGTFSLAEAMKFLGMDANKNSLPR